MTAWSGNVAVLAVNQPVNMKGEAQLLPFGRFAAIDGRPGPGRQWEVTNADGARLSAELNVRAARTPVVIDYDHQTLSAVTNGHPSPAAGWVKATEWRNGVGLFARVEWTARARALIEALEYRFISPVIHFNDAFKVTRVVMASLVNLPALQGMAPVVAQLSALSSILTADGGVSTAGFEGNNMTEQQREHFLRIFGHTPAALRAAVPSFEGTRPEVPATGFEGNDMTEQQRDNFLRIFSHTPAQLRKLVP